MRTRFALALPILAAALVGCGSRKPTAKEIKPFQAAIEAYLKTYAIEAKPEDFERLEITGDTATVKVRMRREGDMYGVIRWVFHCQKEGDAWVVTKLDRMQVGED